MQSSARFLGHPVRPIWLEIGHSAGIGLKWASAAINISDHRKEAAMGHVQPKRHLELDDWLTVEEAAEILNRRRQTVCKHIRDGKIKATRKGVMWLIAPDDCHLPPRGEPGRPRKTEWDD